MNQLEQMLGNILDSGEFGDFLDTTRMAERARAGLEQDHDKRRAEAEIIAAPFRTKEGKACLEALLRHVVMTRLTLPIQGATVEQQAMHAIERQGQNQIVAFLFEQIAIADGERVEAKEG